MFYLALGARVASWFLVHHSLSFIVCTLVELVCCVGPVLGANGGVVRDLGKCDDEACELELYITVFTVA